MPTKKYRMVAFFVLFAILLAIMLFKRHGLLSFLIPMVFAHCDTMSGPVIQAAQKALETGNVDLVLIWVQEKDEDEIRKVFSETEAARKANPQNKDAIDMHFFEALVRIHRAGEGAPYEGIKPAGSEVDPGIEAADKAVESGSVDELVREISTAVTSGIGERFSEVMEKKKHLGESVRAGREYVRAYVEFIHYVEKLHLDAAGKAAHHGEPE